MVSGHSEIAPSRTYVRPVLSMVLTMFAMRFRSKAFGDLLLGWNVVQYTPDFAASIARGPPLWFCIGYPELLTLAPKFVSTEAITSVEAAHRKMSVGRATRSALA